MGLTFMPNSSGCAVEPRPRLGIREDPFPHLLRHVGVPGGQQQAAEVLRLRALEFAELGIELQEVGIQRSSTGCPRPRGTGSGALMSTCDLYDCVRSFATSRGVRLRSATRTPDRAALLGGDVRPRSGSLDVEPDRHPRQAQRRVRRPDCSGSSAPPVERAGHDHHPGSPGAGSAAGAARFGHRRCRRCTGGRPRMGTELGCQLEMAAGPPLNRRCSRWSCR